jgi:hypothetical protein
MPAALDAVLLLYFHPLSAVPPDLTEAVRALRRYSAYPILPVNLQWGVPQPLLESRFRAVILHYTLFYANFVAMGSEIPRWLEQDDAAYKIAIFQDEQAYTEKKVDFCGRAGVQCVFSCLSEEHAMRLYGRRGVEKVVSCLPGYVSERLERQAPRYAMPDARRPVDVGYRGRRPAPEWGPEAADKYRIAGEFAEHAAGRGLVLDISTREEDRIYGDGWYRFLGRCRGTLGAESGGVISDPEDPDVRLPYRTVAPRHFEAAALGTCQLLYEGRYSDVMEPDVHYLALCKDMSNVDDVLERFCHPGARAEVVRRAHTDLIASGRFTYRAFAGLLDDVLAASGAVRPGSADAAAALVYPRGLRWRLEKSWIRLRHRAAQSESLRRLVRPGTR